MEKKGNVITQMALISDLLEKINLESEKVTVVFEVDQDEFDRLFHLIYKKADIKLNTVEDTFSVKIGVVEYVYNTNTSNA